MKRYRRSYWGRLLLAVLFAAVAALRWYFGPAVGADRRGAPSGPLAPGVYQVQRVIDGDTLVLVSGNVHVRLQGIDSPEAATETAPAQLWADEATAYSRGFVRAAAGRVRLQIDGETHDHYGRALALVWQDDRMLNEELVRSGLARAKLNYDYSQAMKNRLRTAQQEAQQAQRGIWSRRGR